MDRAFFVIFVTGFERGKEDLLPLPLKEDSHSISKSKVRKMSAEMFYDGSEGTIRCNETREYGNFCTTSFFFPVSPWEWDILDWDDSHIMEHCTHQTFKFPSSFLTSLVCRQPVCFSWYSLWLKQSTLSLDRNLFALFMIMILWIN